MIYFWKEELREHESQESNLEIYKGLVQLYVT